MDRLFEARKSNTKMIVSAKDLLIKCFINHGRPRGIVETRGQINKINWLPVWETFDAIPLIWTWREDITRAKNINF